jgi:hypothetical protein
LIVLLARFSLSLAASTFWSTMLELVEADRLRKLPWPPFREVMGTNFFGGLRCVARYLSQLDTADRQEPTEALAARVTRLKEKLAKVKEAMGKLAVYEKQMLASPDQQVSLTDPDSRSMATSGRGSGVVGYRAGAARTRSYRSC